MRKGRRGAKKIRNSKFNDGDNDERAYEEDGEKDFAHA